MADRLHRFRSIPSAPGFAKIKDIQRQEGLHVLKNNHGLKAVITSLDGKLVSLVVPGAKGAPTDIISGCARFKDGAEDTCKPAGITWKTGFANDNTLELSGFSNTIDNGFGGFALARVHYALTDDDRLKITCEATLEQFDVLNLPGKLLLNLNGAGNGSVLNHLLQINADNYIPLNETGGPTGTVEPVTGRPFDFRKATTIGARIHDNNEQLKYGNGYDHIFVLNKHSSRTPIVRVKGDKSGIVMEICIEAQALHFCSCNQTQSLTGKKGDCRNAFTIEGIRTYGLANQPQAGDDQIYKCTHIYSFKTGR
jgi:aldose 1-epimerase